MKNYIDERGCVTAVKILLMVVLTAVFNVGGFLLACVLWRCLKVPKD